VNGAGAIVGQFVKLSLGGVLLGGVMGYLLQNTLARVFNDPATEVTLTVLASFGAILLAEGTPIKVSGILSVVTLGLTMAAKGKYFVSPSAFETLENFWFMLGHMANTIIFFVSGLIVISNAYLHPDLIANLWWRLILLWVLLHLVRAIMLLALWPLLSRGSYEFNWRHACSVVYGGLRGAVGLTLGLIVSETLLLETNDEEAKLLGDEVLFYVAGVAYLTLLVNGPTMEYVLKWLGLSDQREATERQFHKAAVLLAESSALALGKLQADSADISGTDWVSDSLIFVCPQSVYLAQLLLSVTLLPTRAYRSSYFAPPTRNTSNITSHHHLSPHHTDSTHHTTHLPPGGRPCLPPQPLCGDLRGVKAHPDGRDQPLLLLLLLLNHKPQQRRKQPGVGGRFGSQQPCHDQCPSDLQPFGQRRWERGRGVYCCCEGQECAGSVDDDGRQGGGSHYQRHTLDGVWQVRSGGTPGACVAAAAEEAQKGLNSDKNRSLSHLVYLAAAFRCCC
jgi:NhaP-type Na+/H+ or K+/H+ antiporter